MDYFQSVSPCFEGKTGQQSPSQNKRGESSLSKRGLKKIRLGEKGKSNFSIPDKFEQV